MIGTAARIDVPGHGSYVIAADKPKEAGYPFLPNMAASRESLTWSIDGDDVEITSHTNVLTLASEGTIWVYHDRNLPPPDQPGPVRLQAADTVEWLLPKK